MSLAFFDTNVFVYELDAADPRKQRVAAATWPASTSPKAIAPA